MSYSTLIKEPAIRVWIVATLGTRLAVTTVPLGAVLLAADRLDSYALGGLLAGGYAAGEALLAPWMGRRVQDHPLRRELVVAVVGEAVVLLAALAVVLTAPDQWWWAVAAMALAGGIASGVPGALRTYVSTIGDDTPSGRDRALALDTMINQGCWLAGPALAAGLATLVSAAAPIALVAAGLLITVPAVLAMDGRASAGTHAATHEKIAGRRLVRLMVVPITASALIMTMMAGLDVLLPALLADHGASAVLAGITLAALAAASIACSALYGSREWPGSARLHSLLAIVAMSVLMVLTGLMPTVTLALVAIVAVGVAEAPALLGRSIALTHDLPPAQWPVGFSLLYSAGGVGYTIGSVVAGGLVERFGAGTGFVTIGAACAVVIALVAGLDRPARTTTTATDRKADEPGEDLMLQACVNGDRSPDAHAHLPVDAAAMAAEAVAAVAAGADSVHLHPKNQDGVDSLAADDVERCVSAVRAVVDVPVGVTTGAWIEPDPRRRLEIIRSWPRTPSFASVNWHEDGAADVADALLDLDIGIEAGLFHADAARAWTRYAAAERCLRVLIELPDDLDETEVRESADEMIAIVEAAHPSVPILLHGCGPSCWPTLRYAAERGLHTRIGLEDTLHLSTGDVARDNSQLVDEARRYLESHASTSV